VTAITLPTISAVARGAPAVPSCSAAAGAASGVSVSCLDDLGSRSPDLSWTAPLLGILREAPAISRSSVGALGFSLHRLRLVVDDLAWSRR
jgi:hypothetical protein